MYRVQLLKEATRDLAKLDKSIGRRIVDRIN
jgi:mRNA-degrading endonuclease RelE of RelBE toxin-antitoxin system